MLARYRLLKLADAELTRTVAYYEREREGLGFDFFECYEAAVLHAMRFPDSGTPLALKRIESLGLQMRRVVLERFPYDLITMVSGNDLVVIAVAHQHRRPGYWLNRLAKTKQR